MGNADYTGFRLPESKKELMRKGGGLFVFDGFLLHKSGWDKSVCEYVSNGVSDGVGFLLQYFTNIC